jgi:hypothetical protein
MNDAHKIEQIDAGLQQLEKILLEEQTAFLILHDQNILRSETAPSCDESQSASELKGALAKIEALESSLAQSELMQKATMNALSASQLEVSELQEEVQAHKLRDRGCTNGAPDPNDVIAELNSKLETRSIQLEESQRAADALRTSLAEKDVLLQDTLTRCHELETAAAFVVPSEVTRLASQLQLREEEHSGECGHLKQLLACSEQSLHETRALLDEALRSNVLSNSEWKARHDRKCEEYLKTIAVLQRTIQQYNTPATIASERDRLRAAYEESNERVSALNLQIQQLQHYNGQLKQQVDILKRNSSSAAPFASGGSGKPADKSTLSGQLLDFSAFNSVTPRYHARSAAANEPDEGNLREPPALFISERQYSLLVEENARLIQNNAALLQDVASLKQQLLQNVHPHEQHKTAVEQASEHALEDLFQFCLRLGHRLDSIEYAVRQQLLNSKQ